MAEFWSFFVVVFTTFLPVLDPFGCMTIFAGVTSNYDDSTTRKIAIRAVGTATVTLLLFSFFGDEIFSFLGTNTDSLKIVGGVLFFKMGMEMLNAASQDTSEEEGAVEAGSRWQHIAIAPLGVPLICDPASMTNGIIHMQQADSTLKTLGFVAATVLMLLIILIMCMSAAKIMKFMGKAANMVIDRIMGLLLMAYSIDSFVDGATPILKKLALAIGLAS